MSQFRAINLNISSSLSLLPLASFFADIRSIFAFTKKQRRPTKLCKSSIINSATSRYKTKYNRTKYVYDTYVLVNVNSRVSEKLDLDDGGGKKEENIKLRKICLTSKINRDFTFRKAATRASLLEATHVFELCTKKSTWKSIRIRGYLCV